jgi:hypothetical protein
MSGAVTQEGGLAALLGSGQGATVVKNTSVGLVGALTAVLKNGMKVEPALVRPS